MTDQNTRSEFGVIVDDALLQTKEGQKINHINRLKETQQLYILAARRDSGSRAQFGQAITDLFSGPPLTLREQEIVSDILMTLLSRAEKDLKQALADRMAVLENAPLRVVLHLSTEEIDVAKPVIMHSPVLSETDLMFIIQTHKSPYWQAVAARPDLQPGVIRALVNTKDHPVARTLAANTAISIPVDCLKDLMELAKYMRDLQGPLLERTDVPDEIKKVLYTIAGQHIARDAAHVADDGKDVAIRAAADVVNEYINAVDRDFKPTDDMCAAAKVLFDRGELSFDSMMKSLKNAQIASFMAQIMLFVNTDFERADRIVGDQSGRYLSAVCRLYRGDKKLFLQLFLMTERYRGGDRMIDPSRLNAALIGYDNMNYEEAKKALQELKGG